MNDQKLESLLLGARDIPKTHGVFTRSVMRQIEADATFIRHIRTTSKQPKRSLRMKLRTLHGAGLVIAIIAALTLLSGIVYAGVRFAPDLIQLFDKKINEQGRVEYSVPAFAKCGDNLGTTSDTFAVRPAANVSDEEVKKILQAKCELEGVDKFARDQWPTYGEHKKWHDGDTIYYTRPDILGTVKHISNHALEIEYSGGLTETKKYYTFQNQDLQAFARNEQVPLKDIKPGDFVFVIERVAETYHEKFTNGTTPNPHGVGAVAVVKMTLPSAYYGEKQKYIYEVQPCMQNPGETCPKEYQSGIDVFPRGSEGATNPSLRRDVDSSTGREINGVIASILPDRFILKSNKGHLFTVHLSKQIIDNYNRDVAPIYQQNGRFELSKVSMRPGSWISIDYWQQASDNPRDILLSDIFKVYLLTDLPSK
jgi:hypothetical protein